MLKKKTNKVITRGLNTLKEIAARGNSPRYALPRLYHEKHDDNVYDIMWSRSALFICPTNLKKSIAQLFKTTIVLSV